jgi:UDP-N-acetyl-2-amino-2-deoxyglucuronate dehydrogenase
MLKRAFDERRFGKVYMVNINVFWTRPQEYYDAAKWRGTWELDGGAFMNQASHYVDLVDWLVGPVESVRDDRHPGARHRSGRHRRPQHPLA